MVYINHVLIYVYKLQIPEEEEVCSVVLEHSQSSF